MEISCNIVGNVKLQPPWKTARRIFKKFKMLLAYDAAISLQDVNTAALFTIAKRWRQHKGPPVAERRNRNIELHIQMVRHHSRSEKGILLILRYG